jgi:hypothetical protein
VFPELPSLQVAGRTGGVEETGTRAAPIPIGDVLEQSTHARGGRRGGVRMLVPVLDVA